MISNFFYRRECYFDGERPLIFFIHYSESNCNFECLTNQTLKECQCVAFYMPRMAGTPICGYAKMDCVKKVYDDFNIQVMDTTDSSSSMNCKCLHGCFSLYFQPQFINMIEVIAPEK